MSQGLECPNPVVGELYRELGRHLAESDDAFVDRGPALLQNAISQPGFFDGVDTDHAEPGDYTRRKVIGEEGGHVIRFMEWPPEYALLPHEHHGRPCFEVLVDGTLFLTDMDAEPVGDDHYRLTETGHHVCDPGDAAVVDPRTGNDIHAVYSPVRSRSLHVYPDDNFHCYGYVLDDDADGDLYRRKRFTLDD
jgi:hypothetical protein